MAIRFAAHLNDGAITLLDRDRIAYRQPGFALLEDRRLTTGDEAYANARIAPRRIQHRYWSELSTAPLADHRFEHLSSADLASRQLEDMWRASGANDDDRMVIAVPAYMEPESLGLLLGIAAELKLPVAGLVDAAVAATRREYRNAVPVHVDIGLHATTLTRLAQADQVQFERAEVLRDCGLYALYDAWVNTIAEAFVRQSRFDPLHTAETEQMLFNSLPGWLAEAARRDKIELELRQGGATYQAELESLALTGAAAPWYQRIASNLRALYRAGETPAIQSSDHVARLPGLADMLVARVGGELFTLEPGATARGALARCRDGSPQEGSIGLRRRLPWDQSPMEVAAETTREGRAGTPTHILHRATAYAIDGKPLVLGSEQADGERTIVLGTDMPGVSRRHCSLRLAGGQCLLEDHSRYGTFLNGHRIDGSTVLETGDSIRVGSPGYELQMISTARSQQDGT